LKIFLNSFNTNESSEKLSAIVLKIAIMGRCCSGKSSLINNLLNTFVCPTSSGHTTRRVVKIIYGKKEKIIFEDNHYSLNNENLKEYITKTNETNMTYDEMSNHATICIPSPFLKGGVEIWDLPGLHDEEAGHITKLYRRILKEVHAVICVIEGTPEMSLSIASKKLLQIINDCFQIKGLVFLVVTKLDLIQQQGDKPGFPTDHAAEKRRLIVFYEECCKVINLEKEEAKKKRTK